MNKIKLQYKRLLRGLIRAAIENGTLEQLVEALDEITQEAKGYHMED